MCQSAARFHTFLLSDKRNYLPTLLFTSTSLLVVSGPWGRRLLVVLCFGLDVNKKYSLD